MSASGLVVLAGHGDPTLMLFWALAEEFSIDAVVLEQPVSRTALLKNRLRRLGAATVAGQVAFQAVVAPALRWTARERLAGIRREFNLRTDPIAPHLVRSVESANGEGTVGLLRQLRPKVVVVSGTRILSKRVLGCTDASFINMHAGITPTFRGVHGGYWALAEQQREQCGVTVHLVDAGVDTGAILGQALISPTSGDNFITYPVLQLAAGIPLMKDAVRAFLSGASPAPLVGAPGPSRQWYHPTAWGYLKRRLIDHVK